MVLVLKVVRVGRLEVGFDCCWWLGWVQRSLWPIAVPEVVVLWMWPVWQVLGKLSVVATQ